MTTLNRLKLELGNKEYFTDDEYLQLLKENGYDTIIQPDYNKETDQKMLLLTVLDILEAVSNDIDIMRKVETEFTTTSDAYKYMEQRIQQVKDRIASIPEPDQEYSPFSLMYTRK
ncbi:MAG: hypothetical protein K0R00_2485 [Herbinix sp.]|nr:hypothetical protein [Herbinix sp.]